MRILIYSDVHISRTSSILPSLNDSKYTYRQQMIINTGEWLSQIMVNEKPDAIINCGDTFDQHTITSYDVNVASKFFSFFNDRMRINGLNIPHYVLVGNHEMLNANFNAVDILNNIPGIFVINQPTSVDNFGFLPYCNYTDILQFPEGEFLFSHQDIQGSVIRGDFTLPDGIEPSVLKQKYKLVFNGHIHKSSINGNVINVGSVTTHSFSDDMDSVPKAYIFDTKTLDLQIFSNYQCPLFRKCEVQSVGELRDYIQGLDYNYKYVLQCTCPFEIKNGIKCYLDTQEDIIISNRLNVKVTKNNQTSEDEIVNTDLQSNVDVFTTFKEFLNTIDLKYPKQLYLDVLKEGELENE